MRALKYKGYAVLGGITLLAVAAMAARRRGTFRVPNPLDRTAKAQATATEPLQLVPDLEPSRVGDAGFQWPLDDVFPDAASFQRALNSLGYTVPVNGDIDESTEAAVKEFKLDYNLVAEDIGLDGRLTYNGDIDIPTVPAIALAVALQHQADHYWHDIIAEAIENAKPEVV